MDAATATLFRFQMATLACLNEHMIWRDCSIMEVLVKTYTRRTIKREEAEIAKKESPLKKVRV